MRLSCVNSSSPAALCTSTGSHNLISDLNAISVLIKINNTYLKFEAQDGIPVVLLLLDGAVDDGLNGALILEPRRLFSCHDFSEAETSNFEFITLLLN